MEIPSKYEPQNVEERWYQYWEENDFFTSKPDDREPYTIVIPPPNVTGSTAYGAYVEQYHTRCIDSEKHV